MGTEQTQPSLYERLGGITALRVSLTISLTAS